MDDLSSGKDIVLVDVDDLEDEILTVCAYLCGCPLSEVRDFGAGGTSKVIADPAEVLRYSDPGISVSA